MSDITKIKGTLVAETEKAVLIKFASGKVVWIPKSTLKAEFNSDKSISQFFSIATWILEKNEVIIDVGSLVKKIIEILNTRHADNLIAIYGIGSYFDDNLPPNWIKKDIDLILVVKSLEKIPKEHWDKRFYSEEIEGYEIFSGYNTLEMYQNKEKFKEFSGANYEWAIIELRLSENSRLLFGEDIRNQLPKISDLSFDYDDILARGFYHIEKSLKEQENKAMWELSKAIFKISFYVCKYFIEDFSSTSVIVIGKKLKDVVEMISQLKEFGNFFSEAVEYRTTGKYETEFKSLRVKFITHLVSSLKSGALHRKIEDQELKLFLITHFRGFPNLIRFLKI
ncbi:MAG: hypothetical protein ACFE8N_14870 [Promethearchaeota archaeon]